MPVAAVLIKAYAQAPAASRYFAAMEPLVHGLVIDHFERRLDFLAF